MARTPQPLIIGSSEELEVVARTPQPLIIGSSEELGVVARSAATSKLNY